MINEKLKIVIMIIKAGNRGGDKKCVFFYQTSGWTRRLIDLLRLRRSACAGRRKRRRWRDCGRGKEKRIGKGGERSRETERDERSVGERKWSKG